MYFEMFTSEYVVSGVRFFLEGACVWLRVVSRYFNSDNADNDLHTKWACQYSTPLNRSFYLREVARIFRTFIYQGCRQHFTGEWR